MTEQATIYIVQNDIKETLQFTLSNADGTPIVLTGATLKFNVMVSETRKRKFSGDMNIVTAASGICEYVTASGDFDIVGDYEAQIQITFGNGKIMTLPNILIKVIAKIPA